MVTSYYHCHLKVMFVWLCLLCNNTVFLVNIFYLSMELILVHCLATVAILLHSLSSKAPKQTNNLPAIGACNQGNPGYAWACRCLCCLPNFELLPVISVIVLKC